MPPEIIGLIEKPPLLIAILLVGAFIGLLTERFLSEKRRRAWREKNRWRWQLVTYRRSPACERQHDRSLFSEGDLVD